MAQAADGSIIIDTSVDDSGLKKGMATLGSKADAAIKGVTVGIAALGGALVATGIAAVKVGSDIEASLAKASTLFGDVAVDTDGLTDKVIDLSSETGIAASQIGESLYNALSAGIPVTEDMGDAMEYMEKNAKLAKAGFTDIDTAVTATAKVLNAYKMDVSETDKVHKILMQTQNKGITTVGELGAVLAQVTPTAAAMSVSFEQVGAALATMTAQGTPTAQATTQLNSLFAELGKLGTTAQKGLEAATKGTKYADMGFQEMMKSGVPLNEVLELMDQYAISSGKSMLDMFSSLEAGKSALSLSGDNVVLFTNNLEAMGTSSDLVGDAYEKVMNTLQENSKRAITSAENLGASFYRSIQGEANNAVKTLADTLASGELKTSFGELGVASGKMLTQMSELAKTAIPAAVKGFTFLAENLREIVAVAAAAYIGFKSFSILKTGTQLVQSCSAAWGAASLQLQLFTAANGAAAICQAASTGIFTLAEVAVGLLTGKISLATAAQWAWNAAMTANPIGILVAALGALTLGVGVYIAATRDTIDPMQEMIDKSEDLRESCDSVNDGIRSGIKERAKACKSMEAEAGGAKILADKLFELNAKEELSNGTKSTMLGLVNELNKQIPDLGLEIDNETGRLNNQTAEVYKLIDANLEMMKVKAAQEDLTRIARDQYEADKALNDIRSQSKIITDELAAAETNMTNTYTLSNLSCTRATIDTLEMQAATAGLRDELVLLEAKETEALASVDALGDEFQTTEEYINSATASIDESSAALENMATSAENTTTIVGNSMQVTIEATNLSKEAVAALEERFKGYETTAMNVFSKVQESSALSMQEMVANLEENQRALDDWATNLQLAAERGVDQGLLQTIRDAGPEMAGTLRNIVASSDLEISHLNEVFRNGAAVAVTAFNGELNSQTVSPTAKDAVDGVTTEFNRLPPELEKTTTDATGKVQSAISSGTPAAVTSVTKLKSEMLAAVSGMPNEFYTVGQQVVQGLWNGMNSLRGWIRGQVSDFADGLVQAARSSLDIHSPSRKAADAIGKPFAQGIGVGLENELPKLEGRLNVDLDAMISRMRATVLSEQAQSSAGFAAKSGGAIYNDSHDSGIDVNVTYYGTASSEYDVNRMARELCRKTEMEMRSRGMVLA